MNPGRYCVRQDCCRPAFLDSRFDYETFTPTRIVRNAPGYITAILDREELLYPVAFSSVIMLIDPA